MVPQMLLDMVNPALKRFLLENAGDASSLQVPPTKKFLDILDSLFALLQDVQQQQQEPPFSPAHTNRIANTVLACAVVETFLDHISSLHSETERIKFISRSCGINAEPGFCEGDTPEAVRSLLLDRASTLCHAFNVCSRNGTLASFFHQAFQGDPCLNGRLATIQRFAFQQETGLSADLLLQQDIATDYDDVAFKFTELMYGLSFDSPPEKDAFVEYLRQQADYETLYKPWVTSPTFSQIYSRAREFFS